TTGEGPTSFQGRAACLERGSWGSCVQRIGFQHMKRLILGVAAVFIFTAGQAAAEGLPPTSRIRGPEPVGPNWNGFYVGLGIGAGAVVQDVSVSECPYYGCGRYGALTEVFGFDGVGGEGIFGTVTVGYDRVIRPGWVLGAFADYDFGS